MSNFYAHLKTEIGKERERRLGKARGNVGIERTFLRNALGMVNVEWIQQYVLRTEDGISSVCRQSIGLPTYCRAVTIRLKLINRTDVSNQ